MPDPIETLFVSIGSDVKDLLDDTKKGVKEAEKDLGKLEKSGKRSFSNIASFAKKVGASIIGIVAIIGTLIAAIKKATDAAVEAEKSYTNLAGSVAAANREFGQSVGTVQSWEQNIKALSKEMRIFSETELNNASSRLVDMTKRLGLTEDQMLTLLRRTADLSAGKVDLTGGIERVTAAMRGEAESAEYLGLSLNENTVKAYAEAQGLVWKNLTDVEKAQQRYNLFLQQTNELQGRAATFAETLAGKEAALNAELENQNILLGEAAIPLREGYVEALKLLTASSEDSAGIVTKAMAAIAAAAGTTVLAIQSFTQLSIGSFSVLSAAANALLNFEDPFAAASEATKQFSQDTVDASNVLMNLGDIATDAYQQILDGWQTQREEAKKAATEAGTAGGGASPLAPVIDATNEDAEELQKILDDVGSELLDLQEQTNQELEANAMEHAETMAEIEKEAADERLEINEKYDERLRKRQAEIIKDARDDLSRLQDRTDEELAKKRQETNRDEQRETEDHLEEMRRLRLDFLDNLEDAVKNRDARAVRDLQRQFQRENSERQKDYDTQKQRRRQDSDEELNELVEKENKQAQEIIDRRTEALQEIEAEVKAGRERDLADLEMNLQEAKTKEQANFDERQAELENALLERLEAEAKALADMKDINEEGAQQILGTLAEYFGVGGEIDKLMEDFSKRRQQKLTLQIGFEKEMTGPEPSQSQQAAMTHFGIPSFQTGGTLIANRPTLAQFGEVPELVQFTPLSQLRGGGGQRMEVDLKLSGSAPPGIRSGDRDAIAGLMVNALRQAGIDSNKSTR